MVCPRSYFSCFSGGVQCAMVSLDGDWTLEVERSNYSRFHFPVFQYFPTFFNFPRVRVASHRRQGAVAGPGSGGRHAARSAALITVYSHDMISLSE